MVDWSDIIYLKGQEVTLHFYAPIGALVSSINEDTCYQHSTSAPRRCTMSCHIARTNKEVPRGYIYPSSFKKRHYTIGSPGTTMTGFIDDQLLMAVLPSSGHAYKH